MNNNPLIIRLKEAEQQIISCVNAVMREQSLPCYLVEPIIEKVHRQVIDEAQKEYKNALATQRTTKSDGNNSKENKNF